MISYNNSSKIDDISYSTPLFETATSRTIKFIILLILQLGSIGCSLFLLFHLITKPTFYRTLHNHTIIALVIVSFFQTISDLPMTLEYLRIGQAPSSTFCLMWNFFGLSNYAVGVWTMTWASFERHLFVFHDRLLLTFRGKILFHYIPLFVFIAAPWFYYLILIFFYPCQNIFYQSLLFCGWCCYVYNNQLVFFNWMAFGVTPVFSITFLSVWLIIRVVTQKRRVQQRVHWRQHRRMIIQLLIISCLYLCFASPTVIIGLIQLVLPNFAADIQVLYLYYTVYLLPLLVPFVCLSTFRELWEKICAQTHPPMLFANARITRHELKQLYKKKREIV